MNLNQERVMSWRWREIVGNDAERKSIGNRDPEKRLLYSVKRRMRLDVMIDLAELNHRLAKVSGD